MNDSAQCEKTIQMTLVSEGGVYKATENIAEEANHLHHEFLRHLASSFEIALRIGEILTRQKGKLAHGEFMPWVKSNLDFDHRSATRYMSVYKHREELRMDNVSNLTEAHKFIKRLTYPEPKSIIIEGEEVFKLIFTVDDIAKKAISYAVAEVKAMLVTDSNGKALAHIANDYMECCGGMEKEHKPLHEAKKMFERIYDVKITIRHNKKAPGPTKV